MNNIIKNKKHFVFLVIAGFILLFMAFHLFSRGQNFKHTDLKNFVQTVQNQPAKKMNILPQLVEVKSVQYTSASERSPFASAKKVSKTSIQKNQKSQVIKTNSLENLPLSAFTLEGIVIFGDQSWGIMKTPDGLIHRVTKGSKIGNKGGEVVDIKRGLLVVAPRRGSSWDKSKEYYLRLKKSAT